MGRKIMRVPLDFNHPLNEVWPGYLRPDELDLPACPDCRYDERHSTGYSPEAHAISSTFYPHQIVSAGAWPCAWERAGRLAWCDKIGQAEVDHLIAEGRLQKLVTRKPTEDNQRDWEWISVPRTAAEVNAANRPGHRRSFAAPDNLDHDGINRHILIQFRCQQLGIPLECPTCAGVCDVGTEEQRAAAEAWEATEPPTGEGWQLWETVSEGSPISQVFPTAEELAAWMSSPDYAWGISNGSGLSYADALAFVQAGWAPTMVATPDAGPVSGEEYIGRTAHA